MDDFNFDQFHDISDLGDIFPDIEPYLKDVTATFDNASAKSGNQRLPGHVDASDSDSGISGDCFVTGILKHLEMYNNSSENNSMATKSDNCFGVQCVDNCCGVQCVDNCVFDNNISTEINKTQIPIKNNSTPILLNRERPIINVLPNSNDKDVLKHKQIIIKSQPIINLKDNFKRESGIIMPKVTKVKILKHSDSYPLSFDHSLSHKNDKNNYCEYPKISLTEIKDSSSMFSKNIGVSDSSSKPTPRNIVLSENPIRTINLDFSKHSNDFNKNKPLSLDMSRIDDFQSMDCSESSYDMFQSSPVECTNTLSSSTFNCFNNSSTIHHQQFDRIIKKQERMIKNRHAASLSRQRKKEYVERLEHKSELQKLENLHLQSQLNDIKDRYCALEQENQMLIRDVQMWRDRYYDLERQNIQQRNSVNKLNIPRTVDVNNKTRALKTTAASTTLLGIFILLTFNFNSWTEINNKVSLLHTTERGGNNPIFSNNVESSSLTQKISGRQSRLGRTLFSIVDNTSLSDSYLSKDAYNKLCSNISGLNISETIRLTLELNEWGSRYKAQSVKENDRIQNEKIKLQILSKEMNSIHEKSKLKYYQNPSVRRNAFNSAELEVYQRNNGFNFLGGFLEDMELRADTLYLVSFHSDNLIYPATAHGKNYSMPKITVLLPAEVRQDSDTHYKMMKIDCNVLNFTVVNLKKMKLP